MFEHYSPALLRKAIEIELKNTNDPKTAARIALKNLENDPTYYGIEMQKAVMPINPYLNKLVEGNKRFISGFQEKNVSEEKREETAHGQNPFAIIVDCSDSRVAPEIIFDQGIGNLFVIRGAGGVLDTAGLGSVEFAVKELNVSFIVVLGHTDCGAIKSALNKNYFETESQEIAAIMEEIMPAIDYARECSGNEDEIIKIAAFKNACMIRDEIMRHEFAHDVNVISGIYDVESGYVSFNSEDVMQKARMTKYIKRESDGKGGYKYWYKEEKNLHNSKEYREQKLKRWHLDNSSFDGAGNYVLYHGTNEKNSENILKEGLKSPDGTMGKYFMMATSKEAASEYAAGKSGNVILQIKIPKDKILDFIFPGEESDVYTGDEKYIQHAIKNTIDPRYIKIVGKEEKKKIPQTETPEFKKWFGSSKVVDKDGKPLVVYHGSVRGGISDFSFGSNRGIGLAYFSDSPEVASKYAIGGGINNKQDIENYIDERKNQSKKFDKFKSAILPVYLKIESPISGKTSTKDIFDGNSDKAYKIISNWSSEFEYIISDMMEDREHPMDDEEFFSIADSFMDSSDDAFSYDDDEALSSDVKLRSRISLIGSDKDLFENVKSKFDGFFYSDAEAGGTTYVVFSPTQIKSATGNRGTFDPNEADMTKANQLKEGTKIESEHKGTIQFIRDYFKKHNALPPEKEIYAHIAGNHIDGSGGESGIKDYYTRLLAMEDQAKGDKKRSDLEIKVIKFLIANPNPPDSKVHDFSDKLGIDTHKLEAVFYKLASERAAMSADMQKAGGERFGHKYIKRVPKPTGKGFYYFYTKQQFKDYKEKGILPEEKSGKFNLLNTIKNLFGFSNDQEAKEKIKDDYRSNEISSRFSITLESWSNHLSEYFINKDKWQKFFNREPGDKKESTGSPSKKSEKKEKAEKKESIIKISVMKLVNDLYSEVKPVEKKKERKKRTINTGNGSKIEKDAEPSKEVEKEQDEDEKQAAREGYYNEKPAEILNVGKDVWGAARHNFDTYEKFNADINQMESDGTASAYVTKKNLFGDYGLANKDERVANGETEFKVLASFAIREYLSKVPGDNEESRQKYMEFCRSITRLDQNTTTAKDFLLGLSEVFGTLFPSAGADNSKGINILDLTKTEKENSIKTVGPQIYLLMTSLLGRPDRAVLYRLDKRNGSQFEALSRIILGEVEKRYTYEEIKEKMFGAVKASGIKVKKGDNVIFSESWKDQIKMSKSSFPTPEDEKKYKEIKDDIREFYRYDTALDMGYFMSTAPPEPGEQYDVSQIMQDMNGKPTVFHDEATIESVRNGMVNYKTKNASVSLSLQAFYDGMDRTNIKPIKVNPTKKKDVLKFFNDRFGTSFTNKNDAQAYINQKKNSLQIEAKSHIQVDIYYPEGKGQIVKTGKDKLMVSFKFPDGTIKTFNIPPTMITSENIESVKRDVSKKGTNRLNLYIESRVSRKGGKNYSNIKVTEAQKILEKDYGFKAVQYGNSMPDVERQYHTQWALQSFSDLSDVLKIPIGQITVNGKLGIAFGARGNNTAFSGALAHYEPGTKMINLTRANGYGALAHEWGHFLDNILTPDMNDYISSKPRYIEKEITAKEMKHGMIFENTTTARRGGVPRTKRYFYDENTKNKSYPFVELNEGQSSPGKNPKYVGFYWYSNNRSAKVKVPESVPFMDIARSIGEKSVESLHKQVNEVIDKLPKTPEGDLSKQLFTEMFLEDDYLNRKNEAFARAFEAYVADKLEDNGRKNTYLSSKQKTTGLDGGFIYPQAELRSEINGLFDQFFDLIRGSEELKKAIAKVGNKIFKYRMK